MRLKPILLWVWREVPFPGWMRRLFLRVLNPSWMVGAMALVQDEQGRILVLEHTYRRRFPWGLPGGWLKRGESPEEGLAREVFEETGFQVSVDRLLAAHTFGNASFDLLYQCTVQSGTYHPTDETRQHRWVKPNELPVLLRNQVLMLRKAGVVVPDDGRQTEIGTC